MRCIDLLTYLLLQSKLISSFQRRWLVQFCVCQSVCLCVSICVCVCLCQLVPLLKLLYHAPNDSSHHLSYMALIVILILTLSVCLCLSVCVCVSWFLY